MVFGLRLGLPKKASSDAQPGVQLPPTDTKAVANSSKTALTVNEFVARTKRCREKGLEPTKPELIAYARYLGIDPIIDGDLMWIADEALNAPLPSEWTEHHDSADRVFYYNVQTHASSWTHPLEQLHRDTYKSIVSFRSGEMSKEDQSTELEKLRRKCEEAEREAHKELQAWTEHVDEQGQKFYFNRDQQRSVWTDPRPARCHSLYLQMKALRVLSKHCGQSCSARGPEPLSPEANNRSLAEEDVSQSNARSKVNNHQLGLNAAEGGHFTDEGGNGERRKRKKRRDPEGNSKHHGFSNEMADEGLGDLRKPLLDAKKPPLSAVEEVRAALGVSPSLPAHGRSSPGSGRLPSPPGDGLTTVGRAKVRAGIRLEPLKGGA